MSRESMIKEIEGYRNLLDVLDDGDGEIIGVYRDRLNSAIYVMENMYDTLEKIEALCEMVGDNGTINPAPLYKDVARAMRLVRKWK